MLDIASIITLFVHRTNYNPAGEFVWQFGLFDTQECVETAV